MAPALSFPTLPPVQVLNLSLMSVHLTYLTLAAQLLISLAPPFLNPCSVHVCTQINLLAPPYVCSRSLESNWNSYTGPLSSPNAIDDAVGF